MKKKITLIVVAVLLIISLIVGMSYAYWRHTFVSTSVNKINSSCFSMELTNEKNNIVLESTYPITDEKGKSLTPYSFTITNTCDLFASYTINLEMLEGTTLNSKYIKTMINSEAITNLSTLETATITVEGATESRVLFKGSLGAGDSTDYTFRLWMDYDTPNNEESMNKSFQSKITVTSEVSTYSPVENGFNKLAEALLVNEYQTTNVNVAKNKIASKQSVDFSKTAPIIDWQVNVDSKDKKLQINKADPALIGQYGIVTNATKVMLSTSYDFNSETGYYTIKDPAYYDLSDVDFNADDYYFCGSTILAASNNTLAHWNGSTCIQLYKINKVSQIKDGSITLTSGTSINIKSYILNVDVLGSLESESDKSDKGLYQEIDDYGTTYYYRGNVTNNIVKFADAYWKVIRINGDGSIRLIYNGTASTATGIDATIVKGGYSYGKDNPTYVGYMYSNTLNTSYNDTIKNDSNSKAKVILEQWYKTNILDKGYSSYIADSGFCNDRSLTPSSNGDGYTTDKTTYFAPYVRMIYEKNPTMKCSNIDNDLFTLSSNSVGNKKLTYPIGLITGDELMYAGFVYLQKNTLSYLSSNTSYWTISPYSYDAAANSTRMIIHGASDTIGNSDSQPEQYYKPVINLKTDTEIISGIGTKNDPFIIK